MKSTDNIDFTCDTEDCIHWKDGVCKYPAAITIQEHCCVDYEARTVSVRCFAPAGRMVEIANNAMDALGELLNGRDLYDALSGSLKMSDAEILAAGFTTLKRYMESEEGDGG